LGIFFVAVIEETVIEEFHCSDKQYHNTTTNNLSFFINNKFSLTLDRLKCIDTEKTISARFKSMVIIPLSKI